MNTQVLDPNAMLGQALPGSLGQLQQLVQLSNADPTPALAGAAAAAMVGVIATPLTGVIVAKFAPRAPLRGALLALGVGIGASLLAATLAGAGVAATAASASSQ